MIYGDLLVSSWISASGFYRWFMGMHLVVRYMMVCCCYDMRVHELSYNIYNMFRDSIYANLQYMYIYGVYYIYICHAMYIIYYAIIYIYSILMLYDVVCIVCSTTGHMGNAIIFLRWQIVFQCHFSIHALVEIVDFITYAFCDRIAKVLLDVIALEYLYHYVLDVST